MESKNGAKKCDHDVFEREDSPTPLLHSPCKRQLPEGQLELPKLADKIGITMADPSGSEAGGGSSPGESSSDSKNKKKRNVKKRELDVTKLYPGRYPVEGDPSVDLAAINLSLGSNIEGTAPFDLTASHGAFPSFIWGPRFPPGSDIALADGPYENINRSLSAADPNANTPQCTGDLAALAASIAPENRSEQPYRGVGLKSESESESEVRSKDVGDVRPDLEHFFDSTTIDTSSSKGKEPIRPGEDQVFEQDSEPSGDQTSQNFPFAHSVDHVKFAEHAETAASVEYADFVDHAEHVRYAEYVEFAEHVKSAFRVDHIEPQEAPNQEEEPAQTGPSMMQRSPSNGGMPPLQQGGNGSGMNNLAVGSQMGGQMPVNTMPAGAGQQMDINVLYQKVMELSEVLRENRESTKGIVASAEQLALRAAESGVGPDIQEADREISASRLASLNQANNKLTSQLNTIKHENRENTKLIGEYETAIGAVVEMVRGLSYKKDMARIASEKEYNNRLQKEKDEHLETRLERDHWHAEYLKVVGMIRHAFRLREEEEEGNTTVVAALQSEVRAYRDIIGLPKERPEEESGWEVLKFAPESEPQPPAQ